MKRCVMAGSIAAAVCSLAIAQPGAQGRGVSPDASEACSLMAKEDAAAALGEAVTGPRASAGRSMMEGTTASSCEYEGSGLHKVNLNVWHTTGNVAQFRQMYQMACAEKKKDGLAGLGDLACWYNDKHEELQALKGSRFISVELRRSGNPTEAIKMVAQKALARVK